MAASNLLAVAASMCAFISACTSMCSCRASGGSCRSSAGARAEPTGWLGSRGSEDTQCACTTGGSKPVPLPGVGTGTSSAESTIGDAGITPRSV